MPGMKLACNCLLSAVLLLNLRPTSASRTADAAVREPFLWGVATAAYQIEGATTEEGRGPCIWDSFSMLPGKISNGDNASIADDSYHQVAADIGLIKKMGVNAYRFSISWSRIMPSGRGAVNPAGIAHYNSLIDQVLAAGLTPLVTLYHWDLPLGLQREYGGWLSSRVEADFAAYADLCFALFGDRVKKWATLNEPWTAALHGYVTGVFAPGRCSDRARCSEGNSSTEGYLAAHHMLLAHAAAVQLYRANYQEAQRGLIGIVLNQDFAVPLRPDNPNDVAAAQRRNEFAQGWFADPLTFGRYPQSMVDLVGARLPQFTADEQLLLAGSYDFMGLNHYSSKYYHDFRDPDPFAALNCSEAPTTTAVRWGGWPDDQLTVESRVDLSCELIGPQADSPWLHVVPRGLYNAIMWNHDRYSAGLSVGAAPVFYITENGCDVPNESFISMEQALNDTFRSV